MITSNSSGRDPAPVVVIHEHSDALRMVLLQALSDEGLARLQGIQAAGEVAEALAAGDVDVLLLDLDAPDADALSMCRRLRQHHPRLGILATCTRGDGQRLATSLEAGADHLLTKPLAAVELAAHIRRLHARARSWGGGLAPDRAKGTARQA